MDFAEWLGIQESNLWLLIQSQLCYRYTNPHLCLTNIHYTRPLRPRQAEGAHKPYPALIIDNRFAQNNDINEENRTDPGYVRKYHHSDGGPCFGAGELFD